HNTKPPNDMQRRAGAQYPKAVGKADARPSLEGGELQELGAGNGCRQALEETDMLGKTNATANIAVRDLAIAREFYTGTLGLAQVDAEGDEVIVMKSGDTLINVYRSQFAGTNKANALTWTVGDEMDRIV